MEHESFLESNSPDILHLSKTNLDDAIDFGNFTESGCFLYSKRTLFLICMVMQFMSSKDFLFLGIYF